MARKRDSGFRHKVAEKCALPGCYTASSGNFLPIFFWDNLLVPSSGVKNPKTFGENSLGTRLFTLLQPIKYKYFQ